MLKFQTLRLLLSASLVPFAAACSADDEEPGAFDSKRVAIVGYGIEVGIQAPFKALRTGPGPAGHPDQFLVSQIRAEILNLLVVPDQPDTGRVERAALGTPVPAYRVGEWGTQVITSTYSPDEFDVHGHLRSSSWTEGWSIRGADGSIQPWPARSRVDSRSDKLGYRLIALDGPKTSEAQGNKPHRE